MRLYLSGNAVSRPHSEIIMFEHRISILVVVLGMTAFTAWSYVVPTFFHVPISHVRVAGKLREITEASLREAVFPHLENGFFGLDVAAVRADVLKLPWLKSVSVRRIWPGSLHIAVIEHEAEARWYDGGLIAIDGTLFYPPPEGYPVDLPVLKGTPKIHAEMLGQYRELQLTLDPIAREIRQFTRTERPIWKIELDTGLTIVLDEKNPITAVEQFARTASAVLGERIDDVLSVDLRYANGFAVRWRPVESLNSGGPGAEGLEEMGLLFSPRVPGSFRVDLRSN
uniref:Cell division protein FtsQ n=1 Tax=Candidatus Kentrum eta TaxID=2126337 RepID=A0A450VFD6_9GAMM|nr:MAG: cell division protein FtsQ [Candidatus Kentron sp. H]VFK03533.1 MAG: cell division protein FtsQ [Candidatus Kentron sp. H]VFK06682.1 MAG: cell division protein FtsQ [Candidatus Kentron sp. H]